METDPLEEVFTTEEKPKNRKDVLIMYETAIKEATKSGNLERMINAHIDYFAFAIPEIKAKAHAFKDQEWQKLEPTPDEIRREILKEIDIIVPEQILQLQPMIERRRQRRYLKRLQAHRQKIETLVKKHVGWDFSQTEKRTPY